MKGCNVLQLSQATVMEALQEYFHKRTAKGYSTPKITAISWNIGNYYSSTLDVTMVDDTVEPRL
jgi:hypothetical protein